MRRCAWPSHVCRRLFLVCLRLLPLHACWRLKAGEAREREIKRGKINLCKIGGTFLLTDSIHHRISHNYIIWLFLNNSCLIWRFGKHLVNRHRYCLVWNMREFDTNLEQWEFVLLPVCLALCFLHMYTLNLCVCLCVCKCESAHVWVCLYEVYV